RSSWSRPSACSRGAGPERCRPAPGETANTEALPLQSEEYSQRLRGVGSSRKERLMIRVMSFDSLRRVALRGSLIVFLLALSLAHPQTSSRLAGAPATSAAEMSSALVNNW